MSDGTGVEQPGLAENAQFRPPIFSGNQRQRAFRVLQYVQWRVSKDIWALDRIQLEFARRTVSEIVRDGTTFAYAPCSERTIVAAAMLAVNSIDATVVYHERRVPGFGPSSPHFALEMRLDGEPYLMDFGARETRFMPGLYWWDRKWQETITLQRDSTPVHCEGQTVETLYARFLTPNLDIPSKLVWYESQIGSGDTRVLRERLAYSLENSLYRGISNDF